MTHFKTLLAGVCGAALLTACSGDDAEYTSSNVERDSETVVTIDPVDQEYPADPVTSTELSEVADEVFDTEDDTESYGTIASIAGGSTEFETLTELIIAADLLETLEGEGPYTVFAPNDAAFAKVDETIITELKIADNLDQLSGVLTYHVVPGEVIAADLIMAIDENGGRYEMKTVQGTSLYATRDTGPVYITDATGSQFEVISTDIEADNGVIHVIDGVMMPG